MKTYLKSAYPSLSADGKLLIVVQDGLPADYFRQEGHREELQKIQNADGGRNPEDTFPDLTKLVSDNINMDIEEIEEEDEESFEDEF